MNPFPSGWAETTLGELCLEMRNGISIKPVESGGLPILRISAVRPMKLDVTDTRFLPASFDGLITYKLRTDDLLFTRYNGNRELVGACARVTQLGTELVYPDKLIRVRINTRLAIPSFVEKAASAEPARRFIDQKLKTSAGQVGVSGADLKSLPVPLPPRAEQQRIADKLDTVLARVDACRDRVARVAPLLKRFRQSVLAAATAGLLTREWRESEAPAWSAHPLSVLCGAIFDGPFGSNLKSEDYVSDGVRVVRLENIGHLFFDRTKETFISSDKYSTLRRHTLEAGDLLFSSFVDEEVRVCEFPGNLGVAAINKADCFCLRVDSAVCDRRFLAFRLACKTTYDTLKAKVHGATRPRINLRQLRDLEVALPSLIEQAEIVRRVETLFAFADRLEDRLATAQAAVDRLTPALLAKAFRGELVPQDPADEPAAELLRRLQAQTRQNQRHAAPKRGRRAAQKASA